MIVPGDVRIQKEFIQPTFIKEKVNVNWVDGSEKKHEREPVTLETEYINNSRTEDV